jgi:hypothetical protein
VARETGGGPVRRGQGIEDGGTRPACPREDDEGGACTSAKKERERPGRPAEGHWAGWPVGLHKGEGRWAMVGSKTGDGPKLRKNFFLNFN